jgi:hypothetical protein
VRVPPRGGRGLTPQNQAGSASGLARIYFYRRSVRIQFGFQAARALGFRDRDPLLFTVDQHRRLIFDRVDGLPIGAQQPLDQAWEADLQRIQKGALRMQCWNEALHRCKRSHENLVEVYTQLLQEKGLSLPTGRGFGDAHRQKSEQARERRKAKPSQGEELPAEPQPVAIERKPGRKRRPSHVPAIAPLPPA